MEKLTIPLLVRLTPEDQAHLEALSKLAECTVPQLARYFVRVGIYKKLSELKESDLEG
ncbi:MAG: hypothetical protein HGA87_01155 [Desulfobulbaceae bacterium]|nr:hypothetical protein [Desulfobulbaceae bacterium]